MEKVSYKQKITIMDEPYSTRQPLNNINEGDEGKQVCAAPSRRLLLSHFGGVVDMSSSSSLSTTTVVPPSIPSSKLANPAIIRKEVCHVNAEFSNEDYKCKQVNRKELENYAKRDSFLINESDTASTNDRSFVLDNSWDDDDKDECLNGTPTAYMGKYDDDERFQNKKIPLTSRNFSMSEGNSVSTTEQRPSSTKLASPSWMGSTIVPQIVHLLPEPKPYLQLCFDFISNYGTRSINRSSVGTVAAATAVISVKLNSRNIINQMLRPGSFRDNLPSEASQDQKSNDQLVIVVVSNNKIRPYHCREFDRYWNSLNQSFCSDDNSFNDEHNLIDSNSNVETEGNNVHSEDGEWCDNSQWCSSYQESNTAQSCLQAQGATTVAGTATPTPTPFFHPLVHDNDKNSMNNVNSDNDGDILDDNYDDQIWLLSCFDSSFLIHSFSDNYNDANNDDDAAFCCGIVLLRSIRNMLLSPYPDSNSSVTKTTTNQQQPQKQCHDCNACSTYPSTTSDNMSGGSNIVMSLTNTNSNDGHNVLEASNSMGNSMSNDTFALARVEIGTHIDRMNNELNCRSGSGGSGDHIKDWCVGSLVEWNQNHSSSHRRGNRSTDTPTTIFGSNSSHSRGSSSHNTTASSKSTSTYNSANSNGSSNSSSSRGQRRPLLPISSNNHRTVHHRSKRTTRRTSYCRLRDEPKNTSNPSIPNRTR